MARDDRTERVPGEDQGQDERADSTPETRRWRSAPDPGPRPEERLEDPNVKKALAQLPEKQREAVVLHDLFGLKAREVGTALGMSVPAVEALLFRGRRQLRLRLRPVQGALVVPVGVREALSLAIPGFSSPEAAVAVAGGVRDRRAGLLAKIAGAPAAAKVAAGVVAIATAGSVAAVETRRAEDTQRPRAERRGSSPRPTARVVRCCRRPVALSGSAPDRRARATATTRAGRAVGDGGSSPGGRRRPGRLGRTAQGGTTTARRADEEPGERRAGTATTAGAIRQATARGGTAGDDTEPTRSETDDAAPIPTTRAAPAAARSPRDDDPSSSSGPGGGERADDEPDDDRLRVELRLGLRQRAGGRLQRRRQPTRTSSSARVGVRLEQRRGATEPDDRTRHRPRPSETGGRTPPYDAPDGAVQLPAPPHRRGRLRRPRARGRHDRLPGADRRGLDRVVLPRRSSPRPSPGSTRRRRRRRHRSSPSCCCSPGWLSSSTSPVRSSR